MMFALGHDKRLQRTERGYQCAIEVAIGVNTPQPEFTLFQHSTPVGSKNFALRRLTFSRLFFQKDAQEKIMKKFLPKSRFCPNI